MTIQAWRLLRKLKRAQICLDGCIGIDVDDMKAITIHDSECKHRTVNIKRYKNSLESTLKYLHDQKLVNYNDIHTVQVTYAGWFILSTTAVEITKIVLLNVVLPVVVSVIAAIITTKSITCS